MMKYNGGKSEETLTGTCSSYCWPNSVSAAHNWKDFSSGGSTFSLVNTEEATLHGVSGPPSGTQRQVGAHVRVLITRTCGVSCSLLQLAALPLTLQLVAPVLFTVCVCVCVCDGRRLPPKLKEFGRFLSE